MKGFLQNAGKTGPEESQGHPVSLAGCEQAVQERARMRRQMMRTLHQAHGNGPILFLHLHAALGDQPENQGKKQSVARNAAPCKRQGGTVQFRRNRKGIPRFPFVISSGPEGPEHQADSPGGQTDTHGGKDGNQEGRGLGSAFKIPFRQTNISR